MKKKLNLTTKTLVFTFLLALGSHVVLAQQSYDFPSDRAALPYNVDEVVALIKSSVEAPNAQNEYVQMVFAEEGFPILEVGSALKKAQEKRLQQWVESNPAAIEKLLIARKKNYDLFYQQGNGNSVN